VSIQETRLTETSLIGFGTRRHQPVVLKVIRKDNSEEWRCGEILRAFDGRGMIPVIQDAPGAVLLPRLVPGHNLGSLCLEGQDDRATEILGSIINGFATEEAVPAWLQSVDRLMPDFARFREGANGFIPMHFVDRAEALFGELCATQTVTRLLHGDLHHHNVLFDAETGWVAIDPWGAIGELEFEVGASLRNPIDAPHLLGDSSVIERRVRRYEHQLRFDADRALKWAFATTVLGILWPPDPDIGLDLRGAFVLAAGSMLRLLE
jgi:streptomycin 6-kinase